MRSTDEITADELIAAFVDRTVYLDTETRARITYDREPFSPGEHFLLHADVARYRQAVVAVSEFDIKRIMAPVLEAVVAVFWQALAADALSDADLPAVMAP